MRKRYEEQIKELKESFEKIIKLQQEQVEELKTDFDNYKIAVVQREYLIKTKFKGTIKNKKLLKELKMTKFDFRILDTHGQIATSGEHSYDDLCKNIFGEREKVCIDVLFNLIKDLEEKQKLLDKYEEQ